MSTSSRLNRAESMHSMNMDKEEMNDMTQQVVVPVRTGQMKIDWIRPLKCAKDIKQWSPHFLRCAKIWAPQEAFKSKETWAQHFHVCVTHAAETGDFKELIQMLELWYEDGVRGEALIKAMERHFLPTMEAEKRRAMELFTQFRREKRSLLQAVKDLKLVVLECRKNGYKPDKDTLKLKFESLVLPADIPTLRIYEFKEGHTLDDADEYEVHMRAVERLAEDLELRKPDSRGGLPFAGGGKGNDKKPKRKGDKAPKGAADESAAKCPSCGHATCQGLTGKGKGKCPAAGQECRKCHQKGPV